MSFVILYDRHPNLYIPVPLIPGGVIISYTALNPLLRSLLSDSKFIYTSGPGRRYSVVRRWIGPLTSASLHSLYKVSSKDKTRICNSQQDKFSFIIFYSLSSEQNWIYLTNRNMTYTKISTQTSLYAEIAKFTDKVCYILLMLYWCRYRGWLIEAKWRIYASVNSVSIIGLDNRLSLCGHQAIIWISAGILLIWPLGTKLINRNPYIYLFIVVCEMSGILSRLECVTNVIQLKVMLFVFVAIPADFHTTW